MCIRDRLCSDWKRRRSLFFGFLVTLAALVLASECLLPGWLMHYPEVLRSYAEYTKTSSFLGGILPSPLYWLVAIVALATVADLCWRTRRQPADSTPFALALSSVLSLTVLIIPAVFQPFNDVLLLPAVLLVIRHWRELRRSNPVTRAATSLFCLCAILPPLLAVVAVAYPLTPPRDWVLKLWSLPLSASTALPFAAFGMLILLRKAVATPSTSLPVDSAPSRPTGLAAAKEQT